jgi:hypothetical protein
MRSVYCGNFRVDCDCVFGIDSDYDCHSGLGGSVIS